MRNTADRYGTVARVLHWTIGLLLIAQLIGGFWIFEFLERGATRSALVNVHKAMGVILLLLVLVRIGWRFVDAPPRLPDALSARLQGMAKAGHGALYAFMVLMPLVGLWTADTGGRPTDVFGLFTIPVLFGESEFWHEIAEEAHVWGAYGFGAFILGHAGVALWHKFIRKDGVADRML